MNKILLGLSTLALAFTVGHSQDIEKKMFGIGVSFPVGFNSSSALQFNLRPIPNIKTILEVGYNSSTTETEVGNSSSEEVQSTLLLGATVLSTIAEKNMEMQFGGRYSFISDFEEDPTPREATTSRHQIAGVFGGEYFFSSYFTMSGELSAGYNFGSVDVKGSTTDISISGISTGARMAFNFYFM